MVQLVLRHSDGTEAFCSGSVIGERSVLTATHCFLQEGIVSGAIRAQGVEYPIAELAAAPNFFISETAVFNDAAIVKTAQPLGLPALPILVSAPLTSQQPLWIYGYGLDRDGTFGVLRNGMIHPEVVTPNHVIDFVDGGQNTCAGDSGGAVVAALTLGDGRQAVGLVGITSSGDGGSCTDRETAYYINLQNAELIRFIAAEAPDAVFF